MITGGYGYEVGDIVSVDTQQEPKLGDIVQYDWRLNNSDCMAMGSGFYLAKVVGKPGDAVSFEIDSFSANGFTGSLPATKPMMWGSTKYADVANMKLILPDGEYLADKWVGQECSGTDENGNSILYNRFTIKSSDKRYSGDNRLISPKRPKRRGGLAPRCRLIASWGCSRSQGFGCSPIKAVRELGSDRRESGRSLSTAGAGDLRRAFPSTRGLGRTDPW